MFAAIPARILLSIIPRCVGKTQRGGWVGGAGGLVPLGRLALAFYLPPPAPSVAFRRTGGGALDIICMALRPLRLSFRSGSSAVRILVEPQVLFKLFSINRQCGRPPLKGGPDSLRVRA